MTPTTPSTRCRLLELPRELRDTIYEHALENTMAELGQRSFGECRLDQAATQHAMNLFLTCRQVHEESVTVHRQRYIFRVDDIDHAVEALSELPIQDFMRIRHFRCVSGSSDRSYAANCKNMMLLQTRFSYLLGRAIIRRADNLAIPQPLIEYVLSDGEVVWNSKVGNLRDTFQLERMQQTVLRRSEHTSNKFYAYQVKKRRRVA
ncbi:hypothetical protein TI39_contig4458g00004 [Zymoseptoria brevis]|uniref:Uncharacterized protein n=1 Tax=Zymoseptoria brevis TaxID=1047168 RepID=A0A0F4G6R5_9PEZI|nr:hypothetical protein TI39_contig4458g00004 [Zymoseptoria brevis]